MKRNVFLIIISVVIIAVIFLSSKFNKETADDPEILTQAENGTFKIEISSSGELDAKNSVNIEGPFGLRRARIWEVKIENLVDEGTVVNKGDYVGSLDASELSDRIENEQNDLLQSSSAFIRLFKLINESC